MIVPNTLSLDDDDDDNDDDNNENNNNNASSTERGGGVSMSSFSLSISVSSRVFFTCVCALMMATSFLGTHNFCVAAPITPSPPPTSRLDGEAGVGSGRKLLSLSDSSLSDEDVSGLQVEFVASVNSGSGYWFPSYSSDENSFRSCTTGQENSLIRSADWSYDATNGYTQTGSTGMRVWGYENDSIMGSLDSTNGQGLSYDVWIKVSDSSSWNAEVVNNPRGWLLSYETSWGPAICLKDDRVNGGNIGTTPGSDGSSPSIAPGYYGSSTFKEKFGASGSVSPSKDGWDHIVGYWKNENNVIKHGVYINGVLITQADSANYPLFDRVEQQLVLGNYNSDVASDLTHHIKGLSVYGFRVWHKKIDQDLAKKLYNLGHDATVRTIFHDIKPLCD